MSDSMKNPPSSQSGIPNDDLFAVDGNGHDVIQELIPDDDPADPLMAKRSSAPDRRADNTRKEDRADSRKTDIPLSENALKVLERRYLKKNNRGEIVEAPADLFRRVARFVASADLIYDKNADAVAIEEAFYAIMANQEFMPNSPTLMNAGRELGQLSACFVLPVEDSMESIFEAVKYTALIHKSGGGTGFSFSRIRPKNDIVQSTRGIASGPISFMHVFDEATETVKQGGTRRGANMAILRVDHPDILDFIHAKEDDEKLNNFNISVAITEAFWKALQEKTQYDLVNPHDKQKAGSMDAREVFDKIVHHAWQNGDPGVIFIDRMNRDNPTPLLGEIESTNPCGEQPLLPYESCNLGSINLAKMTSTNDGQTEIDFDKLLETVQTAVHFLDNVIDMNRYPLPQIETVTRKTRKIGLGIMGFADLLIQLSIPYDSETAIDTAQGLMRFIHDAAKRKSQELALQRGPFPAFKGSISDSRHEAPIRNATRTTIAPTGTISIIAGCSSGIEPLFALAYTRNVMDNDKLPEIYPPLIQKLKEQKLYSDELMRRIAVKGSLEGFEEIPESMRRVFVTSHEISPEWHIRMQAAFQKYTENAVSKTVNFAHDATVEDVDKVYRMAHDLGCKGVTIYRDGSRDAQVLSKGLGKKSKPEPGPKPESIPIGPHRPKVLLGSTTKVNTGQGSLYITINVDKEQRPVEVFANIGKSGGDTAALAEAIGRLISIAFQKGVKVEEISQTLQGITGSRPVWNEGILVKSVPDGIGQILMSRFGENPKGKDVKKPAFTYAASPDGSKENEPALVGGPECPECGHSMVNESGCSFCHHCGYSHCA
jgi:ribonucleoside-diphosphate reductase alpha chain